MRTNHYSCIAAGLTAWALLGSAGCEDAPAVDAHDEQTSSEALRDVGQPGELPAQFALTGCGLPPLCQAKSAGAGWEATCTAQKIGGANAQSLTSFTLADGRTCSGSVTAGTLKGSCSGAGSAPCAFQSSTSFLPTPYCVELPKQLTKLDVCGAPPAGATQIVAEKCEVVQNECRFLATCDKGVEFAGNVTGTGLTWDTAYNYRCRGELKDGKVIGTCTQRGVPAGTTPATCAMSAEGSAIASTCEETLPKGGFALTGCGNEGTICTVAQRGCVWQASCGKDMYRGRVDASGKFDFTTAIGARCTAQVKDGVVTGTCGEGERECAFSSTPLVPSSSCLTLPKTLTTAGCGGNLNCEVQQNGCAWQAACSNANSTFIYKGAATPSRITFDGQNGFKCWADKEAGSERMVGGCSRSGVEVSECSQRIENGRMVLTPR